MAKQNSETKFFTLGETATLADFIAAAQFSKRPAILEKRKEAAKIISSILSPFIRKHANDGNLTSALNEIMPLENDSNTRRPLAIEQLGDTSEPIIGILEEMIGAIKEITGSDSPKIAYGYGIAGSKAFNNFFPDKQEEITRITRSFTINSFHEDFITAIENASEIKTPLPTSKQINKGDYVFLPKGTETHLPQSATDNTTGQKHIITFMVASL